MRFAQFCACPGESLAARIDLKNKIKATGSGAETFPRYTVHYYYSEYLLRPCKWVFVGVRETGEKARFSVASWQTWTGYVGAEDFVIGQSEPLGRREGSYKVDVGGR